MNNTSNSNTDKGPNVPMIISSILMVPGIILTSMLLIRERNFLMRNYNFRNGPDMAVAFITVCLLLLEIYYILMVLLTKLKHLPYEPHKMKGIAKLMLIINVALFVGCFICMLTLEGWQSQGYFSLADMILFTSFPGILVKCLAFFGQG